MFVITYWAAGGFHAEAVEAADEAQAEIRFRAMFGPELVDILAIRPGTAEDA